MPSKARRLCPKCGAIVAGPCGSCASKRAAAFDARRGTAAERGYGAHHGRWRKMVLARDPLCRHPGCGAPATDADHIVPLARGGTWSLQNGQGLCHPHHSEKTAREDGGFGRRTA